MSDAFDGLGNWEIPEAIDHTRFAADVRACARGAPAAAPAAAAPTGRATVLTRDRSYPSGVRAELAAAWAARPDVLLVEGFQAFHDAALVAEMNARV